MIYIFLIILISLNTTYANDIVSKSINIDYQTSSNKFDTTNLSSALQFEDRSRFTFYLSHTEGDNQFVSNNLLLGGSTDVSEFFNFGSTIGIGSNTDKNSWFRVGISNEYELSNLWNANEWITTLSIDIDYRGYSQETTTTTKKGRNINVTERYNERSYSISLAQDLTDYISFNVSKTKFSYSDKTLSINNTNRFNQLTSVTDVIDVIESLSSNTISFYPFDYFDFEFSSGKTIFDNSEYNTDNAGTSFTITPNESYSIIYSYDEASTETEKIISNSIGFSIYWD